MPQCAFNKCENNHRNSKVSEGVSFFRFPSDPFRCAEWIAIVAQERGEEDYRPFKNSTICSIHFDKLDIIGNTQRCRLLKTAIPKLQIHIEENNEQAEILLTELTTTNLWAPGKSEPDSAGEDPDSNSWETEEADANVEANPARGTKRQNSEQVETSQPKRSRGIKNEPNEYENSAQTQEDECTIVAKLWANKLRKLPEDRRDLLIYKINSIMYKELISHNRTSSSCLIQVFKEDPSDPISDNNSCDENRLTDSPPT